MKIRYFDSFNLIFIFAVDSTHIYSFFLLLSYKVGNICHLDLVVSGQFRELIFGIWQ